jgi:hypothetical protein
MIGMEKMTVFPDKHRKTHVVSVFVSTLLATLIIPVSIAHGVQSHGALEGLVSHQLGHLLFLLGMVFLLLRISRGRLTGAGWKQFKGFLWLMLFWNALTFTGHWMREGVAPVHFVRQSGNLIAFQVNTLFDLIFYLSMLDHLLLVPAFILLFLAIRKWSFEK